MKVILATRDQVEVLWNKLQPQERFRAPADNGLYLALHQTLVLIKEETELGSIADFTFEITPSKLREMLKNKSYFEVG